jgi:hypothetical protein
MAGTFASDLAALVEKTKADVNLVHRKVCLDLHKSLVMKSPVDTGRFRANWQVGVGAINSATDSAVDKSGEAVVARAEGALQNVKVGGVIFLTNSLPYAQPLEYGHSKQAPGGMVRITVAEYEQYLANAVGSLK